MSYAILKLQQTNVVKMFVAGDKEKILTDMAHKSLLPILILASLACSAVIAQGKMALICYNIFLLLNM